MTTTDIDCTDYCVASRADDHCIVVPGEGDFVAATAQREDAIVAFGNECIIAVAKIYLIMMTVEC